MHCQAAAQTRHTASPGQVKEFTIEAIQAGIAKQQKKVAEMEAMVAKDSTEAEVGAGCSGSQCGNEAQRRGQSAVLPGEREGAQGAA